MPTRESPSSGEQAVVNFELEFQKIRRAVFGKRLVFNPKDQAIKPEKFPYFGRRARELYGAASIFGKYLPTYDEAKHGSYKGWVTGYEGCDFAYLDNGALVYKEKLTRTIDFRSDRADQIFYQTVWVGEGPNEGETVRDVYELYFVDGEHCVLIRSEKEDLSSIV